MRGEEIQVFGAFALTTSSSINSPHRSMCLPGTHTKWVQVVHDRIESFSTSMAGAVFPLLSQHSILAGSLAASVDKQHKFDEEHFQAGLRASQKPGGLLHQIFSVSARAIAKKYSQAQTSSALSGIIIGNDIWPKTPALTRPILVVGDNALVSKYCTAFNLFKIQNLPINSKDATLTDAFELAQITNL